MLSPPMPIGALPMHPGFTQTDVDSEAGCSCEGSCQSKSKAVSKGLAKEEKGAEASEKTAAIKKALK